MNNVTDLWRIQEIKRLKSLIKEKETSINNWNLELNKIKKLRSPTIKDFAILNYKCGDKISNRYDLKRACANLKRLKDNPHITRGYSDEDLKLFKNNINIMNKEK